MLLNISLRTSAALLRTTIIPIAITTFANSPLSREHTVALATTEKTREGKTMLDLFSYVVPLDEVHTVRIRIPDAFKKLAKTLTKVNLQCKLFGVDRHEPIEEEDQ